MTPLRQQMIAALQLSGKSERTQQSYVREVRLLAQCYRKSPDLISEQELQQYLLHRKNIDGLSPSSMRICYSGIRLFDHHVLGHDWKTLHLIRAASEHRLPAILSLEAVHRLLNAAPPLHNRVYVPTVYSCGLRLHEALSLQVSDIDRPRYLVHVHRGKGAKDRYVPLPHATLEILRLYWKTHRPPTWLFPATGRAHKHMATATSPMSRSSVQGAFRTATPRAGISKRDVGIPTLRHSYATHLLEAGVNLRAIQRYRGHAHLETTMRYLHLTQKGHEDAYQRIDALMRGFQA
jgi:site-specific recombinase XerD